MILVKFYTILNYKIFEIPKLSELDFFIFKYVQAAVMEQYDILNTMKIAREKYFSSSLSFTFNDCIALPFSEFILC